MSEIKRIGVAVVILSETGADKYLVGTRGPSGPLAGYSEFPGGKCLPGESHAACAERECQEETGLHVSARECLLRTQHSYPHGTVDLEFWLCLPQPGEAILPQHQGFVWVSSAELNRYRFPEANAPLIELLLTRSSRQPFAD